MTAFFTNTELANQLEIDLTSMNAATATQLGIEASDVIRDDLRQLVDAVTNETITLYGDGGELIVLPERPVTAVSAVLLAGSPVTFDWRPSGALRRVVYAGSQYANQLTWRWPVGVPVQITYSHGYSTVPNTIKSIALELATRAYVNPEGLEEKTVADVRYRYARTAVSTLTLSEEQRTALDRFRFMDY